MNRTRNNYEANASFEDDDFERYNDSYDDYDDDDSSFKIEECYDAEGNFDYDSLEDAIMDGEYVPEDW